MKNFYKVTIPEPCNEDWNMMTVNEKGRFCNSCEKTVVDFTKLSTMQIQHFLKENQNKKVCGHFKKTQLDTIHLLIPIEVIQKSYSFRKTFLLALLLAMGTTIISCTNTDGKQQKIETVKIVEVPESINNPTITVDSIPKKCSKTSTKINQQKTDHEVEIVKTLGEIAPTIKEETPIEDIDDIESGIEIFELTGFIIQERVTDFNQPVPAHLLDTFPAFPKTLKKYRTKDTFSNKLRKYVHNEFDSDIGKNEFLTGTQKIYTQFEINTEGKVQNIEVRAPHSLLEKEATRVIKKLPVLIPGKYQKQSVRTVYQLPIIYKIEE